MSEVSAATTSFSDVVGCLDYPMLVVTTIAGTTPAGCLAGFHTQCSIDPPHYAVWISKANRTFRVASRAAVFALHFLHTDDHGLAALFGTVTGDDEDKFEQCAWHRGPDGVPMLDDCLTRVATTLVSSHDDGGDHGCFVLAPGATETPRSFAPMMFSHVRDLEAGHDASE